MQLKELKYFSFLVPTTCNLYREKILKSYDGRETAPKSAIADLFLDKDGMKRKFWDVVPGGLSVGVPGTLALLEKLHRNFGSIAWKELFKPAIDLAANGFPVSSRLVKSIKRARLKKLKFFNDTQNIFFKKDSMAVSIGVSDWKVINCLAMNSLIE